MITRQDISLFFDQEAEASKESWEALMELPVKERIRKRKAIENVVLDKEYSEFSTENHVLLKAKVKVNLSDFKEGDCLLLHEERKHSGIKCTLYKFEDDETLILDVFPPNMPVDKDTYYDKNLILDKDLVDLRAYVYDSFVSELIHKGATNDDFWIDLLFNNPRKPEYIETEKCKEKLNETITSFELALMPKQKEAILNSISAKDYYLIQGPPGTGKSFVLSLVILEEMIDLNHKVVVIGPNHLAINNVLRQVVKLLPQIHDIVVKVGQPYNAPEKVKTEDKEIEVKNNQNLNVLAVNKLENPVLIGLTPHSLHSSRARGLECDTLVIDEAGQMSIPLALMGMIRAKKVILAGDHKQLSPIIVSDKVDEQMKKSAFQSLLTDDNCTMLDVSFRMCEPICEFVSELFYDGKVKAMKPGCGDRILCDNPLYDFHHPVVLHHIDDEGEQVSQKEADFIVNVIVSYLNMGLNADEIGVLSPFRAQAALIRRLVRKSDDIKEDDKQKIAIDTIDKMQGQEREAIIVSLAAGKRDYVQEMADFLYNPNKLNVAFSRAKSKLIIVGNISELKLVNAVEYPHIQKMLSSKHIMIINRK